MQIINRNCGHRSSYTQLRGLLDLILSPPAWVKTSTAIEIGSYDGTSAEIISLAFDKVICIDPIGGTEDFQLQSADEIYQRFLKTTKDKNISLIRKKSDDAVQLIRDNSMALIYVDGFHSYEQCKKDIQNYWPKLIAGGFMCGHDYQNEDTPGVTQAVQECFGEPDKLFIDWSWLVTKIPGRINA